MPRSFLVRKRPGTGSVRVRDTPSSREGHTGSREGHTGAPSPQTTSHGILDKPVLEHVVGSQTENEAEQPKEVCEEQGSVKSLKDVIKLRTECSQAQGTCYHQINLPPAQHELSPFIQYPHANLFPNIRPEVWGPLVHSHVQLSPFMRMHPSTIFPQFVSPIHIGMHPYANAPHPVGVVSPVENPSPVLTPVTEELFSRTSSCEMYMTQTDQSHAMLQVPIPCRPIGGQVNNQLKSPNVKTEVINNGFGIKNPIFTDDLQTGITAIPNVPSSHAMTSEGSCRCRLCGLEVDSTRLLQKHIKTHKEVKRFLCTVCGKGFNDTFDLKRHTRTHTGVRPYKCEKCGKAFTQRCSLESHRKKIHGIHLQFAFNERRMKVYVCEECGHSISDPEEHILHLRTQHPNNPALLRCHDRRQFKFRRRKYDCLDQDFQEQRVC